MPKSPSESEITEDNTSEDHSGENNSEIDKIIIEPENNVDDNSEDVSDNAETEVNSNGESV